MNPRDQASIHDIRRAAQFAQAFVEGIDAQAFVTDVKTQSAVLYQIAILGEAVKRLSPEFRQQHTQIPWATMAGMRDKLVHDYDGVDSDTP
ncbi:MAG: HepT-like ribonuclease domain-containing protein [Cyanobacteria bacterium P01_F01_bin.150]